MEADQRLVQTAMVLVINLEKPVIHVMLLEELVAVLVMAQEM